MSFAAGHIVILGAGIAAISALNAIRQSSPDARITLVSKETDPPYYRLNLTRYLAGEVDANRLPLKPEPWFVEQRIDLRRGAVADMHYL